MCKSFMHNSDLGNLRIKTVLNQVTHIGSSCYVQEIQQCSPQHPVYILQPGRSPEQQKLAPCIFFGPVGSRELLSLLKAVLEVG